MYFFIFDEIAFQYIIVLIVLFSIKQLQPFLQQALQEQSIKTIITQAAQHAAHEAVQAQAIAFLNDLPNFLNEHIEVGMIHHHHSNCSAALTFY